MSSRSRPPFIRGSGGGASASSSRGKGRSLGPGEVRERVPDLDDIEFSGSGCGSGSCHWIDPSSWQIQKRIIAFEIFAPPHTADAIVTFLERIFNQYNICKKVFSIGFDNASANTASISGLENICRPVLGGQFFHIRCVCHVFNLCVQDGLRALSSCISPIREVLMYIWNRPTIMRKWKAHCRANNKRPIKFAKDVVTRWNSTYKMLRQAYRYRNLLHSICIDVPTLRILPQQWVTCKKMILVLKCFDSATINLSGVYYPTSHLFISEAVNVVRVFELYHDDDDVGYAIALMRQKWVNYFGRIPMIYLVAFVFDPRYKLDTLSMFLDYYFNTLGFANSVNVPDIINDVTESLNELCTIFSRHTGIQAPSRSSQSSSSQSRGSSRSFAKDFAKRLANRPREENYDELSNYLTNNFCFSAEDENLDVLNWWKTKGTLYPLLSVIARHMLATPCSTVAVEQAFSIGSQILDERRSTLAPESMEALALVADWTRAERRHQNKTITPSDLNEFWEDEDEDEDPGTTGGTLTLVEEDLEEDE